MFLSSPSTSLVEIVVIKCAHEYNCENICKNYIFPQKLNFQLLHLVEMLTLKCMRKECMRNLLY